MGIVPYVHEEIAAEPYVHVEVAAEPYVHEEYEAEPYVHIAPARGPIHAPVAIAAAAPVAVNAIPAGYPYHALHAGIAYPAGIAAPAQVVGFTGACRNNLGLLVPCAQ